MTPPSAETRISDIHLTAFLVCRGHKLVRVEGPPGRREFVFQGLSPDAMIAFYSGDDQVSARALLDALRNLRGLLAQEFR